MSPPPAESPIGMVPLDSHNITGARRTTDAPQTRPKDVPPPPLAAEIEDKLSAPGVILRGSVIERVATGYRADFGAIKVWTARVALRWGQDGARRTSAARNQDQFAGRGKDGWAGPWARMASALFISRAPNAFAASGGSA